MHCRDIMYADRARSLDPAVRAGVYDVRGLTSRGHSRWAHMALEPQNVQWTLTELTMAETDPRVPKTKSDRKTSAKKTDTGSLEHRKVLPDLPVLPELPPQIGETERARPAPAAAAGSAAQLLLQEMQRIMAPPPPQPQLLEIPDYFGFDEDEGDEDDYWEPGLDSFIGDGYEDQELEYYKLHPQLLLAAQEAVEAAAAKAKPAGRPPTLLT